MTVGRFFEASIIAEIVESTRPERGDACYVAPLARRILSRGAAEMKKNDPTILIAEDNADDQILLLRGFKKIGMAGPIHVVSDGLEAVEYMMGEGKFSDRAKYPYPTFIMTDLKMPRGDGFDVLEFLKSNPRWAVIPTVVFSASADMDDIKKAYMLGASSYHVKPRTTDELIHQLLVLHAYWLTCEVPQVDSSGKQLSTDSRGKLGERFSQTTAAGTDDSGPTRPQAGGDDAVAAAIGPAAP